MTTRISLHPASALIGALALGLVLTAASAVSPAAPLRPLKVEIAGIPNPADMLQIKEGTPYVVPAGKLLVLTAVGTEVVGGGTTQLRVNGAIEVSVFSSTASVSSVADIPACLTVVAGSTVELATPSSPGANYGRAWGYLADA